MHSCHTKVKRVMGAKGPYVSSGQLASLLASGHNKPYLHSKTIDSFMTTHPVSNSTTSTMNAPGMGVGVRPNEDN